MAGRIAVELGFQQPGRPARRGNQDDPMRILLMGDFSGRSQREPLETVVKLADRSVLSVDIDSFDAVLARLAPRLPLSLGKPPDTATLSIDFKTLDDFHPDTLLRHMPLFQAWRQTRARLLDPATFTQAAAELGIGPVVAAPVLQVPVKRPREDEAALIQRLLGRRPVSPPQQRLSGGGVDINRFIHAVVQPHVVPDISAHQQPLVAAVDAVISEPLRALQSRKAARNRSRARSFPKIKARRSVTTVKK